MAANVAKCAAYVRDCVAATGAELVVLPESATTGFTPGIAGIWDGSEFEYEDDGENGDEELPTEGTTITFGGCAE